MRRILVDHARHRHAAKRGGAAPKVALDEALVVSDQAAEDVLQLNELLTRLDELDEQQARVVELRVFGGLTVEEAAEALDISPATVKRDWAMAKAWLTREIQRERKGESGAVEQS
jgi:RNA polymerase sigma factor (TIGR02999 family)